MEIAPDPQPVEADPVQIEQVLINLAINARDAMPDGGWLRAARRPTRRSTSVRAKPSADRRPALRAARSQDTGRGMDAGTQGPRLRTVLHDEGAGRARGLGLSTVYGIVKQSGGYIWISSEPGQGTTFTIHMPPTDRQPTARSARIPARRATQRGRRSC